MRVLLVNPPLVPTRESAPPVGLCSLASQLIQDGHQVRVLDLDLELKYVQINSQSTYKRLFCTGVTEFKPDLVGFTSMYNNSLQAERLIRVSKQHFPQIPTVAGGPHFGAMAGSALTRVEELDYVIEGEGEVALSALVSFLEKTTDTPVPNLCYRVNGDIKSNRRAPLLELDRLPRMWTTLGEAIDLHRYAETIPRDAPRKGICVEAGRGCPYTCVFCAPAVFWERKYRVKPIQTLIEEMRYLSQTFGYDSFLLVHDLLTVDRKYVTNLCHALKDAELPVEWMANSRTDIDLGYLLPTMRAAGCWKLFFGVESASERLQKEIDKNLNTEETLRTIESLARNDIEATCSFVIGFPDESLAELSATIRLGARLKLIGAETVQFHRLRLWPPAPLVKVNTRTEFDLESFKLEYPFAAVQTRDVEAIRSSPEFFSGYFAPTSSAGRGEQLAQVELFFQQAVGLAPVTISVLGTFLEERLIDCFYEAIEKVGPIDRYAIDWVSGDPLSYWEAICPLLRHMARAASANSSWSSVLLENVFRYELNRLEIIVGNNWNIDGASLAVDGCVAFPLEIDVFELLRRIRAEQPLDQSLLQPFQIILTRSPRGAVVALQGTLAED